MKQQDRIPQQTHHLSAWLGALAAASLLCLGLFGASSASAAFEQVGCFAGGPPGGDPCKPVAEEKFSEEVQLGGVSGMDVNYTGAGGVPAGTLYAATKGASGGTVRVAMYVPKVNGGSQLELKFSLAWEVTTLEEPYERCGPGLASPTACPTRALDGPTNAVDVAVDQATGNVYVYNGTFEPGRKAIVLYTPKGEEVLTRFGEVAPRSDTTAESPAKIHNPPYLGEIAVNNAGEVYLFDLNNEDNFYHRLMKYVPKTPGNFTEYKYAGTAQDIGAGGQDFPSLPVLDAAGDIYVASKETSIEKYAAADPGAPPVCRFSFAKGGIAGMTVNPQTGEPFFFDYKIPKRLYRLGPCDEESGEFAGGIVETIEVKPERDDLRALAFDPLRQFEPGRAPGVLYGAAPGAEPSTGVGAGEPGQSALGYIFAPTEENPPAIEEQSVSRVTTTTAELGAKINPRGPATRYAFQYIADAAFKEAGESFATASEAPPGGGALGEGQEALSAAASLVGLSPDTTYHYRVVASSHCSVELPEKVCEEAGAAQSFHTFPDEAPGLPDERAYELVSPVQKNGGQVLPGDPWISSCGAETECKPGNNATHHFPMQSRPNGEAIVYEGTPFSPSEGAVNENEYIARRDPKAGWQTTNLTPPLLQSRGGQGYKGFDTELTQGVLEQAATYPVLSPEAPSEYVNLYAQPTANPLALEPLLKAEPSHRPAGSSDGLSIRYAGASADLSRVFFAANDALTGETPFAPEAVDGGPTKYNLYEWERATGQLRLVNVAPGNVATEPVLATSFGVPSAHVISADGSRAFWSDQAGQVYVREDAEATKAIPDPGKFLSAAIDGSKVLLANGHLYGLEAKTTTDLTEGKGGFQGIAGQSDDLSHVYFVDTEVLSGEEENSEGAKAQAGKFNLYAWREGGAARYVATLAADDGDGVNIARSRTWAAVPAERAAEASPQGRFLTFLSEAPLTGYDNVGPCKLNHASGYLEGPCPEAFLYDSATGELACASCNPTGTRPLGWSVLRLIMGGDSLPQPRYLTDSGRLYFDSQDSLSPFDTNDGVEDVYQYEPEGVGTCKRQAGCLSLISAGHEPVDSNFLAIDEDGRNVFFTSRDQLALKDKDDQIDLYDARERGGTPAETEVARGECQGEACVPALSPPNDPTPGSSSFEGAGNVDEQKAQKKHKKKKKHAKKHAHKRAAKHDRGGAK